METVNYGIDLGTTNSLIAKFENGRVTIFKNPIGQKETLASVVAFRKDRILVGDKAREYIAKDPTNVFGSFKRKMGTDSQYYVVNMDENVTPITLSSYVLKELKTFLRNGEKPQAAVITIPASFDTMQSNATQKAGIEAGFKNVFLLQEPIAASLAYFNHAAQQDKSGYWLVYDLGGGTFDVALIRIEDTDMQIVDHEGNNFLGGVDFDTAIVEEILIPEIVQKTGLENLKEEISSSGTHEKLYYILLHKAEEAKKDLSYQESTEIEFTLDLAKGDSEDIVLTITRERFNQIISEKINLTIQMVQQILERNSLSSSQIQQIILVGGSTYIPYVRERLVDSLAITVNTDADPTSAIAEGAAYYAGNKYYQPVAEEDTELSELTIDSLLDDFSENTTNIDLDIQLSYMKATQEEEEMLLVKVQGNTDGYQYRLIRDDGGFDTGFMPLKTKFTEFLPLIAHVQNLFTFRVYTATGEELAGLMQKLAIAQGQYVIQGQPLPKDICIEVDDKENNTTKLELIFERNSLLPQKKTLYREVSRTIKAGSDERLIINILEGDRFVRPVSCLVIACIEISGKDISSDLLKGSDIEVSLMIDESRQIHCSVYTVMTEQEFKHVFSVSEKQVSVPRLKDQFMELEQELRSALKMMSFSDENQWQTACEQLLDELESHKKDLLKLKENDKSDKKFIIAEAVQRIAGSFDKLGGAERLTQMQTEYFEARDFVEQHLPSVYFEKENLTNKFKKIVQSEEQILRTRNASILTNAITRLNKLGWEVLYNDLGYLIGRYGEFKSWDPSRYTNYTAVEKLFQLADKALENEQYNTFRQNVYSITHLTKGSTEFKPKNEDFKGTGIG